MAKRKPAKNNGKKYSVKRAVKDVKSPQKGVHHAMAKLPKEKQDDLLRALRKSKKNKK